MSCEIWFGILVLQFMVYVGNWYLELFGILLYVVIVNIRDMLIVGLWLLKEIVISWDIVIIVKWDLMVISIYW